MLSRWALYVDGGSGNWPVTRALPHALWLQRMRILIECSASQALNILTSGVF